MFFILRICTDALRYFLSLESSSHRDAWTSLLLLLLNRLLKLDSERVRLSKNFNNCFLCYLKIHSRKILSDDKFCLSLKLYLDVSSLFIMFFFIHHFHPCSMIHSSTVEVKMPDTSLPALPNSSVI